jgi:hypothetical protein
MGTQQQPFGLISFFISNPNANSLWVVLTTTPPQTTPFIIPLTPNVKVTDAGSQCLGAT